MSVNPLFSLKLISFFLFSLTLNAFEKEELSSSQEERVLTLSSFITRDDLRDIILKLKRWDEEDPHKNIVVFIRASHDYDEDLKKDHEIWSFPYLTSLILNEILNKTKSRVVRIGEGNLDEVALLLLAGGEKGDRYIYEDTQLVIQYKGDGWIGTSSPFSEKYKNTKREYDHQSENFVHQFSKITGDSEEDIKKVLGTEFYVMEGKQIIEKGLADFVLTENPLSPHFSSSPKQRDLKQPKNDFLGKVSSSRTLYLSKEISKERYRELFHQLNSLESKSHDPILLLIDCGGGESESALEIIALMKRIREKGVPLMTLAVGGVGSAAVPIFLAGTPGLRFSLKNTRFLLHETVRGGAFDDLEDFEDFFQEVDKVESSFDEIHAELMGISLEKFKELSSYEHWMSAKKALKYGIGDGILGNEEQEEKHEN